MQLMLIARKRGLKEEGNPRYLVNIQNQTRSKVQPIFLIIIFQSLNQPLLRRLRLATRQRSGSTRTASSGCRARTSWEAASSAWRRWARKNHLLFLWNVNVKCYVRPWRSAALSCARCAPPPGPGRAWAAPSAAATPRPTSPAPGTRPGASTWTTSPSTAASAATRDNIRPWKGEERRLSPPVRWHSRHRELRPPVTSTFLIFLIIVRLLKLSHSP